MPRHYRFLIGLAIILTGCGNQVSQSLDGADPSTVLTPFGAPEGVGTGQEDFEHSLLILINDKRLDFELPAIITTTVLMDVAEAHSQDMATNNYLAHANLAGLHGGGRLTEAGYEFSYWGETIAGGSTTPAATLDVWLNSPPHKAVLLDEKFQEIGLGFAFDSETKHGYYWTVVVVRPAQ